mgnify:FL=1
MGIGFRNSKKILGKTPGFLKYTKQDMKHVAWCTGKGIKIAVIPDWENNNGEWKVELNINKSIHVDPKAYKDKEALAKMYEYYKYYYDKYNKTNK